VLIFEWGIVTEVPVEVSWRSASVPRLITVADPAIGDAVAEQLNLRGHGAGKALSRDVLFGDASDSSEGGRHG
jgi:hypothetical protein